MNDKDPLDFTGKYNTPLTKKQEEQFLKWATKENKLNDVYDYDLRGAWKALKTALKVYDHPTDNYRGARLVLTSDGVEQRGYMGDSNG